MRDRSGARPRRASRRGLLGGTPSVRQGRAGARAAHLVRPGRGRAEAGRGPAVVAGVRQGRGRHEATRRGDRTARRRPPGLGARRVAGHRPALPARHHPPGPAGGWVGRRVASYAAVAGPGHRRTTRVARAHRGARGRPGRRAQRDRSGREALGIGGQPRGRDPRAARPDRGCRPAGPRARRGAARGAAVVDGDLRDGGHVAGPGAVADQAAVGAAGAGTGRARPRNGRSRGVSRRLPAGQGPHPPLSRRAHVARHGVDRRGLPRCRAGRRLPRAGGHRRAAAAAGGPVSHPLLRRAARLRQDVAGEGDRAGARPAVRESPAGGRLGRGARARAAAELPRPRTGPDRPGPGRSGGQEPGGHPRRDRQGGPADVERGQPGGGAARGARPGAELGLRRQIRRTAGRLVRGVVDRDGERPRGDAGAAARPDGRDRGPGVHRRGEDRHRQAASGANHRGQRVGGRTPLDRRAGGDASGADGCRPRRRTGPVGAGGGNSGSGDGLPESLGPRSGAGAIAAGRDDRRGDPRGDSGAHVRGGRAASAAAGRRRVRGSGVPPGGGGRHGAGTDRGA